MGVHTKGFQWASDVMARPPQTKAYKVKDETCCERMEIVRARPTRADREKRGLKQKVSGRWNGQDRHVGSKGGWRSPRLLDYVNG